MLTRRDKQRVRFAGLAPILFEQAEMGDEVALNIVTLQGRDLGDYGLVAARRVGLAEGTFPLILAGGLFRSSSHLLADALIARVLTECPFAQPRYSRHEPAVGALWLALESAGVVVDDALKTRQQPSIPSDSLFKT